MDIKEAIQNEYVLDEAFRRTFLGMSGEIVLEFLKEAVGFYGSCHVPGDPYTTAWQEGRRSLLIDILNLCKQAEDRIPGQYEERVTDYMQEDSTDGRSGRTDRDRSNESGSGTVSVTGSGFSVE